MTHIVPLGGSRGGNASAIGSADEQKSGFRGKNLWTAATFCASIATQKCAAITENQRKGAD